MNVLEMAVNWLKTHKKINDVDVYEALYELYEKYDSMSSWFWRSSEKPKKLMMCLECRPKTTKAERKQIFKDPSNLTAGFKFFCAKAIRLTVTNVIDVSTFGLHKDIADYKSEWWLKKIYKTINDMVVNDELP